MKSGLPPAFAMLERAVMLFDRDGTPRDCNPATEALLGYSQAKLVQSSLDEFIAPEADLSYDELHERITQAADEESETFEWQIERSNGEPRWVEVTLSPITLDGTQYVLGEFQDLTAFKARGRRLQLLYRVLRHNLRNQMTVIQGRAAEVEDAIDADELEQQIELIRETAEEVGQLSDAVADLERLVEEDATEREQMNIADVVQMLASQLDEDYPEATITVDIDEETFVSADEGFRLALEQAITNAIEHNESDEPEVTISHDTTDSEAIITIDDNGPGIPEMEIEALDGGPTAVEHGSGLGLSIIQWCTRSLGGDIEIDTTDGDGTTLAIQLPRLN